MPLLEGAMAPKFALFTKGSKLPLNKGFKNMFELLQSCAQPSIRAKSSENVPSDMCSQGDLYQPAPIIAMNATFLHADNKNLDQTVRKRRLI